MPTISQLPTADPVSASDLIPISQEGAARSMAVGALLARMQPAIIVSSPSLLGRTSIGPGGPDEIGIGDGLALTNGRLSAKTFTPSTLPLQTTLSATDQLIVTSGEATRRVEAGKVRALFTPGANITIDSAGVISASAAGGGGAPYSLSTLSPVTSLAQGDLVAVSQGGKDHLISYGNLLDGLTIDLAQPAGPASDTDTFWVAQTNNVMLRQTLSALWPWVSAKLPLWKRRVVELGVNTTLDGTVHNTALVVCVSPITVSALAANMGSGFVCELINVSTGTVVLGGGIVTSNGAGTLAPRQSAAIQCITYSGGTMVFASLSLGSAATTAPGPVSGLTASSLTASGVSLSWTAPTSGGAVSTYTIQYRVTGAPAWISAGQTSGATLFTIGGLQPVTGYDLTVVPANDAGPGPVSAVLPITTLSGISLPGAPTAVQITNVTAAGMTCAWTAPAVGGTGMLYVVQYRVAGQSAWSVAASGLSATTINLMNLPPSTAHDIQVTASNSAGSGPASALVTATTAAMVGLVSGISWNLPPIGPYQHGNGVLGLNVHVTPAAAPVQFGCSPSSTILPTSWVAGVHINTDFWGAYVPVPATAGTWYAWAAGTDGSAPAVYATPFTVT